MAVTVAVVAAAGPAVAGNAGTPIVKGPWMQHVTSTSAIIRVEVSPPQGVILEVDGMPDGAASGAPRRVEDKTARALHSIALENLEPSHRYAFKVRAGGVEKNGALTTAPRDDDTTPFHFLAFGDNRTDDAAHGAVMRAMMNVPTPFVVQTGDMVDNGGKAENWQRFFDIEAPLLRERMVLSAVGNHEIVDGAGVEYVRYFGPTELDAEPRKLSLDQLSGTARWGNTRFFLVNGMVDYAAGPTREWMDKALADADEEAGLTWRIILVHHGLRSSGPHGDNAHFTDAQIPALWERHKIDLVLAGHDHLYERGKLGALPYVVTGGGGAPLYRVKKAESSSQHYEAVHHFLDVGVSSDALTVTATRVDGSTIEHCTLKKASDWACDNAVATTAPSAGPAAALSPDEPIFSRSRCGCDVVGSAGAAREASGLLVVLGALIARRRRSRLR